METDNTEIQEEQKARQAGMKLLESSDDTVSKQDTTLVILNRTSKGDLYPGTPLNDEARKLQISGCNLISVLATGGMGCVYLAKQTHLDRLVAVKALKISISNDAELQEWLKNEAMTLGAINHPNIVSCYDVIHSEGQIFLVMEYVPGFMSMRNLVKKYGPLPEDIVIEILYEAVCGLSYVYSKGFVHRDVKPDNLLVYNDKKRGWSSVEALFADPDTRIKICDFGIATRMVSKMAENPEATIARGSPNYMAPEQAASPDKIDFRADVYGLAGTAYFMLTGKSPFQFQEREELLVYKQQNDIPSVSAEGISIHSRFADILESMGKANVEERIASYSELRNRLHELRKDKALVLQKNRFWKLMCAMLALFLAGACFVYVKNSLWDKIFKEKNISLTRAIGYWQGDHSGWYIWKMPTPKGKVSVLMGDDMLGEVTLLQRLETNQTLELMTRRNRPGTIHFKLKNSTGASFIISWFMDYQHHSTFFIESPKGRNVVERQEPQNLEEELYNWHSIKISIYRENLIVFINDEPCYTEHIAEFSPFIFSVDATNAGQIMLKGVFISNN